MRSWPPPKSVTKLRGFMGLTGYYHKFVKGYGGIARPLTNLLKKGRLEWSIEAEGAFNALKTAMTAAPVLALPDFEDEFVIEVDASGTGIDAVLSQKGRPLAFLSNGLNESKKSWLTYEKEMLAILEAVRYWQTYLLGRQFTIQTDQRSLRYLLEQRIVTPEQQKWITKLLGFDYRIEYKPRAKNKAADALSQRAEAAITMAVTVLYSNLWAKITQATEGDPRLGLILRNIRRGELLEGEFNLRGGFLVRAGRVVVPDTFELRRTILHEFHNSVTGGHSGILRTYKRIKQLFSWPGMKTDVVRYVQECDTCQRNKSDSRRPAGVTRATTEPRQAKEVAEAFVRGIVRLHGILESIVTDRDRIFMSSFWWELFKLHGIKLKMSSAYHSQTDG
ncbi:hypothetical protein CRG98_015583 [Punica granatum]|uniref:Integrase catalytic domain-containing protein n=1 Tax=Punica granatum TaxID=22663 RepID=A0A2I0K673_PUNGR|nr:hypothetical protein CRG98_015583 [Punica granatum]